MSRRLRREKYTVGWICALPVELAAAQEMLDEEHEDLEHDENDENSYSLGAISGHNVVIVCLPSGRIGNNPAAAVATQMRATFKGIRFGLMVGIGGGVPSKNADIRLGDVVVSLPHQAFNGVVQYDIGKSTPSGFERTGALNSPPQILLGAVSRVQAREFRGKSKLHEHVSRLGHITRFRRDQAGDDILFEAAYDHTGDQTCDKCNPDMQVDRQPRENEEAVIHYGTVASGNQVMRNGSMRDSVSDDLGGILCFEMEAAGLMNSFPCLVIRGICDYADSHKNKRWQPFAAGTAAAFAKELLSVTPGADIAKTRTAKEAIGNQYPEAEESSRQARQGQEGVPNDDAGTLSSKHSLARELQQQRKYAEAEELFRQVVHGQERVLGKEHSDTLNSKHWLAITLCRQQRYTEAEELFRQAAQGREKVLGSEHTDTLNSKGWLASTLWQQQRYTEAEELFRQTTQAREKMLGSEHTNTLDSKYCLADTLYRQQRYTEAEELFRQTAQGREKVLGSEHTDTLNSKWRLRESIRRQKGPVSP